jgi:site-specific recombinase XerD
LRAANKAPRTIDTYLLAGEQLVDYLEGSGMPTRVDAIHREHVEAFIAHVLDGRSPATAAQRYASLRQWFRWLEEESEIPVTPMAKMSPPKIPEQPVPIITRDELVALIATTKGTDFEQRRDAALIRLFIDTGCRLSEIANLTVDDVDTNLDVIVVMGKGRRARSVPYGDKTAVVLDRYLRVRARHKDAQVSALWLGLKGRLSPSGIAQMVRRRGEQAGIEGLHPHQFRHTFAHRWLAAGGDLQRIAGWADRQMLARYGSSAAAERARDAHRRLALGDQL